MLATSATSVNRFLAIVVDSSVGLPSDELVFVATKVVAWLLLSGEIALVSAMKTSLLSLLVLSISEEDEEEEDDEAGTISAFVEMSPIIPVRSHGQNSPRFQSRQAEQRAHGEAKQLLAPVGLAKLQP